jgi:sterol desaturase/sphingolipid hydroxylase (fatty acid hydroxylase superfamily)
MWPITLGTLVISIGLLLFEVRVLGWSKSSLRALVKPTESARNDLFLLLLSSSQIFFIVFYTFSFNFFSDIRPYIREIVGMTKPLIPTLESKALQIVVLIVLIDFVSYVLHYAMHFVPQFWLFHKVHHSASEFNVITSERAHPVEVNVLSEFFFFVPFAFFGFPAFDIAIYVILRHLVAMLHHCRLPWDWGWFGKYVLVSPQYHRIHHSVHLRHRNTNIALMFPVWDHVFGTYCGDKIELTEIGVDDNNYNKGNVMKDFMQPFQDLHQQYIRKS